MAVAVVVASDGDERARAREGESREGRGGRERVRERSEGAAWRHPKRPGRSGKQEVAGAASALATEQLRGGGDEDDRGEEVGWAGQLRWAARWARTPGKLQVSFCSFIVFLFLFLYFATVFFQI